jgi:hypothetical protein
LQKQEQCTQNSFLFLFLGNFEDQIDCLLSYCLYKWTLFGFATDYYCIILDKLVFPFFRPWFHSCLVVLSRLPAKCFRKDLKIAKINLFPLLKSLNREIYPSIRTQTGPKLQPSAIFPKKNA